MNIHVVQRGDTVYAIARRYGTSAPRIIADNGLSGLSHLVIGQALIILIPQIIHTVRQRDTLWQIARNYGTTVMDILQKNPDLTMFSALPVGRQITISFTDEKIGTIEIGGYAYPHVNRALLERTLPFLTRLTLFGYGFTLEGQLIPISSDRALIDLSLLYGTAPYMLISSITEDGNFSSERASALFRDMNLQNKVLNNIIATMKQRGYVGLDVDFEYIDPEDAEYFFEFLRNASQKLHAEGFTMHVDLAPKTYAEQPGSLYEAHNYEIIGSIADTVLLMTYEWGYKYGPPMAVAPVNRVREVVQFGVSQIAPNKILMGIPNYGYNWTLPFEPGTSRATVISNQYAVQLAARYGAEIMFDNVSKAPYFNYWDAAGRKHIVWFEDVRSIQAKYELITEFGLRGAGYWTLMYPFAQNWAYVSAMFNVRRVAFN